MVENKATNHFADRLANLWMSPVLPQTCVNLQEMQVLPEAPVPGLPLAQRFPLLHLDAQPELLCGAYGLMLLSGDLATYSTTHLFCCWTWYNPIFPNWYFHLDQQRNEVLWNTPLKCLVSQDVNVFIVTSIALETLGNLISEYIYLFILVCVPYSVWRSPVAHHLSSMQSLFSTSGGKQQHQFLYHNWYN